MLPLITEGILDLISIFWYNHYFFLSCIELTSDGFEKHFQVNYLSHFLLTLHLLPLIKQSGPHSRIINVSSKGHMFSEVKLENIQAQKSFNVTKCYGNSKVFQVNSSKSIKEKGKKTFDLA